MEKQSITLLIINKGWKLLLRLRSRMNLLVPPAPNAGKDQRQKEKGVTGDEVVR